MVWLRLVQDKSGQTEVFEGWGHLNHVIYSTLRSGETTNPRKTRGFLASDGPFELPGALRGSAGAFLVPPWGHPGAVLAASGALLASPGALLAASRSPQADLRRRRRPLELLRTRQDRPRSAQGPEQALQGLIPRAASAAASLRTRSENQRLRRNGRRSRTAMLEATLLGDAHLVVGWRRSEG